MQKLSQLEELVHDNFGSAIVVKLSGKLLKDKAKISETAQAIADAYGRLLSFDGRLSSLVLVHGAGPQLNALLADNGFEKKTVDGRRYTTPGMMECIEYATLEISWQLKEKLEGSLFLDHDDVSIDYLLVGVEGMGEKYGGRVGRPVALLSSLGEARQDVIFLDKIVIVPSIATGAHVLYNVNADDLAGFVAARINACCYLTVGEEGGVLRDVHDPNSVIKQLALPDFTAMPLSEGMIPRRDGIAYFLQNLPVGRAFVSNSVDLNSVLEHSSPSTEIVRR